MNINEIRVDNTLGMRYANVRITTPIVLFCGKNFAGKSSLQESIRLAFAAETVRVSLKKDYSEMVSDGAKTGYAQVMTSAGGARMDMPKGPHTVDADLAKAMPAAMPFVLNAQRFAKLSADERREFLFALTGCGIEAADIRRRLQEKGCDKERIEAIVPMLLSATNKEGKRAGFPAASEAAKTRATEAKGAWRGVTGEAYGGLKAKTWAATKPEFDAAVLHAQDMAVTNIENRIADVSGSIASMDAALQRQHTADQEQAKRAEIVAKLPRLRAKLVHDESELAKAETNLATAQAAAAGDAPRTGLVHLMAQFIKHCGIDNDTDTDSADRLYAMYVAEFGEPGKLADPAVAAQLPGLRDARDLLARAVANDRRDIGAAELAEAQNNAVAKTPRVDQAMQDALSNERKTLRETLDTERKAQDKLRATQLAAENADEKTAAAAGHHADVESWAKIGEALDADGIPAELLAQALKPINIILQGAAVASQWAQVAIRPDMTITSDGRRYQMLSESEQWRADAMIAAAIAEISGAKILMLDRVDVLDLPSRADLMIWLDELAAAGTIDTALLFATMKALPTGLPPSITALWVEAGKVSNVEFADA